MVTVMESHQHTARVVQVLGQPLRIKAVLQTTGTGAAADQPAFNKVELLTPDTKAHLIWYRSSFNWFILSVFTRCTGGAGLVIMRLCTHSECAIPMGFINEYQSKLGSERAYHAFHCISPVFVVLWLWLVSGCRKKWLNQGSFVLL